MAVNRGRFMESRNPGTRAFRSRPMAERMRWHEAAEPEGLAQRCRRCGRVLVDYEATASDSRAIDEVEPFYFGIGYLVLEEPGGGLSGSTFRAGQTPAQMCEARR